MYRSFCLSELRNSGHLFIAILGGECDQYTFTSEYLAELSKHLVRMEDLDWSILAEDSTMDYKVVEARKWKDTHIFYIIDEGKWENWLEEVKENHRKTRKPILFFSFQVRRSRS